MRRLTVSFMAVLTTVLAVTALVPGSARGETPVKQIVLNAASREIWINGTRANLPGTPYITDDVLMVPLRMLAEELGFTVSWQGGPPETIVISSGNLRAEVYPGTWVGFLSGSDYRAVILPAEVQQKDDLIFVPISFFREVFQVPLAQGSGGKGTYLLGSDNQPPTASFTVKEPVYAGEEVEYVDKSSDSDGDQIVERQWSNKETVFPAPGVYTVTLQVKDSRGSWSKPYSQEIRVLPRPASDPPRPGDVVENIGSSSAASIRPVKQDSGPLLLFSDNPEYIEKPGVLYQDKLKGEGRLYFWHDIMSAGSLKVYALAINNGPKEARVTILKEGYGGPSNNVYQVARAALSAYYHSQASRSYTLKPGQILVLNPAAPGAVRYQVVHGIVDLKTSDEVSLAVVAVPATADVVEAYDRLARLPADDVHSRGTFAEADRVITLDLQDKGTGELLLADGHDDGYMIGRDGVSGSPAQNAGNYGMLYRLRIQSNRKAEVYLIPAGGSFGGTLMLNGQEVLAPLDGFVSSPTSGIYLGSLLPGRVNELLFMPPGGSCLPVKLLFKS